MADGDAAGRERPVVLVHSSDLHIDNEVRFGEYHGLDGLRYVLKAAEAVRADVVLLAGDTFDNGRVQESVARQAGEILAEASMPVVLLPGNHDPALPEGIFHRSGILGLPQALVIGHTHPESIHFESLDLEILGRPHRSYNDMPPLPPVTPRRSRWQVVIAHGHYVPPDEWDEQAHRSWRFGEAELGAMSVDYIALGHWDRHEAVGDGRVPAYYSGAPDLVQTVNVVRLDPATGVSVARHPLGMPFKPRW
ncbi:MAG: metallophosphoesterase [Hyphomicrobiaceae bacterium]|nr:metallophosphoesterase [Hyphomicrobiaceae bacterium]